MAINDTQKRPPAADRAYEYTKMLVLNGQVKPNEWIAEGDVASALDMSRTPVREAFLHLQSEGLLQLHPRRGAIVVPMTERDIAAVMQLRDLVEGFAGVKAVELPPRDLELLIAEIRDVVEKQRRAYDRRQVAKYIDLDRAFHTAIVHVCENDLIDDIYASLRDKQRRIGNAGALRNPDRLNAIIAEHTKIIEALEKRDLAAYNEALQEHLVASRRALGVR